MFFQEGFERLSALLSGNILSCIIMGDIFVGGCHDRIVWGYDIFVVGFAKPHTTLVLVLGVGAELNDTQRFQLTQPALNRPVGRLIEACKVAIRGEANAGL
jgi:hypothetical protein